MQPIAHKGAILSALLTSCPAEPRSKDLNSGAPAAAAAAGPGHRAASRPSHVPASAPAICPKRKKEVRSGHTHDFGPLSFCSFVSFCAAIHVHVMANCWLAVPRGGQHMFGAWLLVSHISSSYTYVNHSVALITKQASGLYPWR